MRTKGVSHLPTSFSFFKREYETSWILSRMYLGKCMYLQKWTIGHLGRAYFLDSLWGQDFSKYWEVAGAQSVILCEEKHVLLFACLQVAGICTTETEPQKKTLRWRDMYCSSSLSGHLLYEKRQSVKGICPMVPSQLYFKLDIHFLRTGVLIISTSSHQAVLVKKTLCFHLNT